MFDRDDQGGDCHPIRLMGNNKLGILKKHNIGVATMGKLQLDGFNGTEFWYKHWLGGLYTEGVHAMATQAQAHWLIDAILSWQGVPKVRKEEFQVWVLKRVIPGDDMFELYAHDGNYKKICSQEIEFSDFPEDHFEMFLCNNTLMLKSEY